MANIKNIIDATMILRPHAEKERILNRLVVDLERVLSKYEGKQIKDCLKQIQKATRDLVYYHIPGTRETLDVDVSLKEGELDIQFNPKERQDAYKAN